MSRYRWEPSAGISGRYRDTATGRFVGNAVVRQELDVYLGNADSVAKSLAEALRGRRVSLADAELAFRRHIKNVHLNAIALERGGWANLTPRDYGLAGQRIRFNYGKARDMFVQIADGRQRLDGTLARRLELYTEAGRNTYYRSKRANFGPDGPTHVRPILNASDSCDECIELAGRVFEIGDPDYKLPGQRKCLSRCLCTEEYLSLAGGEYRFLEAA